MRLNNTVKLEGSRFHIVRSVALVVGISAAGTSAADANWIRPVGELVQLQPADSDINALTATSDGQRLLVDTDAALIIVDAATFKAIGAPVAEHRPTSGLGVPLSRGTLLMVTTWADAPHGAKSGGGKAPQQAGELLLVDWQAKKTQRLATLSKEPKLLAVSADGSRAAVAYADDSVQIFNGTNGKSLLGPVKLIPATVVMGEHIDRLTSLALSADGSRLALGSGDVSVRLVDTNTGQHPLVLDQGSFQGVGFVHAPAKQLVFTPDGLRILSLEQGGNFALYDTASGKPLGPLVQVRTRVAALAMGADGKRVIVGAVDGQLQSWALQPR